MQDKVLFYYNPRSRGRIVHWLLEELQIPYEIKMMDWQKAEHKTPEFLKINPMGKLPVIVHKGVVVTETPAICMYLADAYIEKGLAPSIDDPTRGTYYRWLLFAINCVEAARMDKRYPRTEYPPVGMLGYGTYEDTMNTFEKAVENGYVTGKFSAADVFIASLIGWGLMQKDLEPRPAFLKYLELCTNRPAYKRFEEQAGKIT